MPLQRLLPRAERFQLRFDFIFILIVIFVSVNDFLMLFLICSVKEYLESDHISDNRALNPVLRWEVQCSTNELSLLIILVYN